MKIIAIYLPQFHRVPENDEWWGEGFTEWTAVKAAKPLYEGHNQPRKPLNNNYYDLTQKSAMVEQSALMKEYGIYGMCFYHYWFKDGRKILEKPAENLLKWTDIDMPFCFSWVNVSWIRSWSNLRNAGSWADKFDKDISNISDNGVLLEQKYGGKEAWRAHFMYLLPFFQDQRYIKIEEKPVFIFYKPDEIACLPQMIEYWNLLAKENGLKGIYFIGTNVGQKPGLDAVLQQEPGCTFMSTKLKNEPSSGCKTIDFQTFWNKIIHRPVKEQDKTYLCAVTGYDDTPRRGNGGVVIEGTSPSIFETNLRKLLKKSQLRENEYVFINAWNEWGEGMYLEPDQRDGYGYLEAVKNALHSYEDEQLDIASDEDEQVQFYQELALRFESYWKTMDRWLTFKNRGWTIEDYLLKRGIKNIAIYGIGILGNQLLADLEGSKIEIRYGIDNRKESIRKNFPVYCIEDDLPEVDLVIVSVTQHYMQIYFQLRKKLKCDVMSLNEILEEL